MKRKKNANKVGSVRASMSDNEVSRVAGENVVKEKEKIGGKEAPKAGRASKEKSNREEAKERAVLRTKKASEGEGKNKMQNVEDKRAVRGRMNGVNKAKVSEVA